MTDCVERTRTRTSRGLRIGRSVSAAAPRSSSEELTVESSHSDSTWTIVVAGELKLTTARSLDDELRRAETSDAERIRVELGSVGFIDLAGLEVLFAAAVRCAEEPQRLRFSHAQPQVERIFEQTRAAMTLCFEGGSTRGGAELPLDATMRMEPA